MAFSGKYPVRRKIIVDNEYLQQLKIVNISVVKLPMNMKRIFKKTTKILSNNGDYKQHSQTNFGPETFKNRSK